MTGVWVSSFLSCSISRKGSITGELVLLPHHSGCKLWPSGWQVEHGQPPVSCQQGCYWSSRFGVRAVCAPAFGRGLCIHRGCWVPHSYLGHCRNCPGQHSLALRSTSRQGTQLWSTSTCGFALGTLAQSVTEPSDVWHQSEPGTHLLTLGACW